jgi:hypothetical protein
MPWTLDSPAFTQPEGVAKMAAWGFYPHVGLGLQRRKDATLFTLDPDDAVNQFALPYWRVLAAIDVEKAAIFNLPSCNPVAATWSTPSFDGVVYRQGSGRDAVYLVVTANLSADSAEATATLKTDVLGMSGEYDVSRIDGQEGKITPQGTTTGTITTGLLPPWGIAGFKLSPHP